MGATDVVPFIPLEGTTMEDCIVLARTLGERVGRRARDSGVPLRARRHDAPTRENLADVRRGEFEGIRDEMTAGAASATPDFGPSHDSSDRRRRRDRRATLPRRVQRLPRPRVEPRRREGRREGGARLVRRPALREGTRPRGRRTGAGVDEPRRHREDAALSRVRHGEDGSRSAGRVADVERDRRPRAGARAVRDRRAPHSAARLQAGDGARAQGARGRSGRRVAHAASSRRSRRRRRRPAAAASPRTPARSARRSRRWSPASRSARRSTRRSTPRCASSRSRPPASVTTLSALVAARRRRVRRRVRRVQAADRAGTTPRTSAAPRSPTRCSAPPRFRSRRRAPARRSPSSPRRARTRETRTRCPTPASPRCSPTRRAAALFTTFASTSRRSRTSRAARG